MAYVAGGDKYIEDIAWRCSGEKQIDTLADGECSWLGQLYGSRVVVVSVGHGLLSGWVVKARWISRWFASSFAAR